MNSARSFSFGANPPVARITPRRAPMVWRFVADIDHRAFDAILVPHQFDQARVEHDRHVARACRL